MDGSNVSRVTGAATTLDSVDRALRTVVEAQRRAARAGEVATRHELLTTTGPEWLRQFHRDVAVTHRQMEVRHLVTADIQASHVSRLRSWAKATDQGRARSASHAASEASGKIADGIGERLGGIKDPLTGLPGRGRFIERLGDAMGWLDDLGEHTQKATRRIGVCHIDLDDFRAINDRLGWEVGDHLLVSIAERLTERIPGHLVARLAGDEFAVLLEDTSGADDATKLADAALAAIGEPFSIDGHDLTVSASIGVVERVAADTDPTEVMRAADTTLSWAKSGGRGRWALFDADRDKRQTARYTLAAALPTAIERGELFLEYQPIVALSGAGVIAAEALVRWRHPALGVLYPDTFIGLAEQSNLIMRMSNTVLMQACREAARWSELTSEPPSVSVNIVASQLRDNGIVAEVATALQDAHLPPHRLQLEIIEGAIVDPDDQSVSVLHDLVGLGVGVAIDDFGTGYSNLSYLRRLPVRTLKIDRSFVAEVGQPDKESDPADVHILRAMVSLGHLLGMAVTAEGVETADQAELLRSIGCDSAQGWYFGRSAAPDEFAAIIAAHGH